MTRLFALLRHISTSGVPGQIGGAVCAVSFVRVPVPPFHRRPVRCPPGFSMSFFPSSSSSSTPPPHAAMAARRAARPCRRRRPPYRMIFTQRCIELCMYYVIILRDVVSTSADTDYFLSGVSNEVRLRIIKDRI